MKFYSSVSRRRLRNIKDVALLSTADEVIHPRCFNLPLFCLNFYLCCVLGAQMSLPSLTAWHFGFLEQMCRFHPRLSSSTFISICLLQELIDTWAQQALMDQSPAATVSPNLTKRSSGWRLDFFPLCTFLHRVDKQADQFKGSLDGQCCHWSKGLINISVCHRTDKTTAGVSSRDPSVRRYSWLVMMAIFHICYRHLHQSIFQKADATGLMFSLGALMELRDACASCDSPSDSGR